MRQLHIHLLPRSIRERTTRRGSTMILVVSMLVLLVIIATAFVGRAQSGRALASAQQMTAAQTDRIGPIAHAVTEEIAQSLFVQPVNPADAALYEATLVATASTAVPRLSADATATRYSIDPLDRLNNSTLLTEAGGLGDGIIDGYNFAPFEVRPWTNWPDAYNAAVSPALDIRIAEANPAGNPSFGDCRWLRSTEPVRVIVPDSSGNPIQAFSHWAHLSWIPTANNGWRLVTDISDVEKNTLTEVSPGHLPSQFFPTPAKRWSIELPYEQWLPSTPPNPQAFDWIPTTIGDLNVNPPSLGLRTTAAQTFQALAFGLPLTNPVGGWFSSNHERALLNESDVISPLPNFLRLKWFGVKADEFVSDSPRNIITRTLCDTDGDGFTDSFWFRAPTSIDRSIRHVVGVSVVDNSALLNVNIATRFDQATTGGKTPADLALVGRLNQTASDEAGYLSSQLNTAALNSYPSVTVAFDTKQFGDKVGTAPTIQDNRTNPTFLSELGVVTTAAVPAATPAFINSLKSDLERTNYFKAMSNGGEVEGYFATDGTPIVRTDSRAPAILDPFTMADELELRAFTGQNNPYVRSRLERALETDITENGAASATDYNTQFLRSAMIREETSEYFDQLDAQQLLFDNRRKLTTVNGARNDLMPPWLWTMPPAARLAQMPGQPATWPVNAIRGWKRLYDLNGSYSGDDYFGFRDVPPQGTHDLFTQFPAEPGAAAGDGNCDGFVDQRDIELARAQFLTWNRKVDLNRELNDDAAGLQQNVWNQHDFARDVMRVLQRSVMDVDSKTSIFGQEADQSLPDYNRNALAEARRAAASWTANIVAASDGPRKFPGMLAATDPPMHPERGVIVQEGPSTLSFIGQEKHPFIVQAFFAVVYPKSGVVPAGVPDAGQSYVTFDKDDPNDLARVVLAVQIANPYNEPIDLWPFRLRAFGQEFSFLQATAVGSTDGKWGYGTFPVLGPATEEGPRTAVVFAIPKALGTGVSEDLSFRVHMMNFLDLSHPWLRAGDVSIPTGSIVPNYLQVEVASVPPGEFFPATGVGNDLFEDVNTRYADSLVFNASKVSASESVAEAGANKWSVKPSHYFQQLSGSPDARDIALIRLVNDPLGTGGQVGIVVDRMQNEYLAADSLWDAALARVLTPPTPTDLKNEYVPPKFVAPNPGSASQNFAHVDIGLGEFLMSWVRISRPWTLDVDRNMAITADERSPRYVFAYNSKPDFSGTGIGAELVPLVGKKSEFHGEVFTKSDLLTKPDSLASRGTRSPFNTPVRGKPTNFTLKTFLSGSTRVYPSFDDTSISSTWPGIPGGGTTPLVVFGDTGAGVPADDLDFYKHPIRMTQRDGPFEQIAEIYDIPVWGPVMQQSGSNWTTLATYGELMVGKEAERSGGSAGGASTSSHSSSQSATGPGFPTFGLDDYDKRDSMRFQFNRGRLSVASVVGFVPPLPGGATILDGFTLDDAGLAKVDTNDDSTLSTSELLTAEQRRLRLARGYSGASTPGLININTAPIEVMRALPNMQQLSYDSAAAGLDTGPPFYPATKRVQIPESIVNYRDRIPALLGFPDGPKYDDRGFIPATGTTELFPFHPGMRGERGIVSVGELALIDREYRPSAVGIPTEPDPEAGIGIDWATNKSWSIAYAGRDPYRSGEDPPVTTPSTQAGHATAGIASPPSDIGSGWHAASTVAAYSAQLPTERLSQTILQFDEVGTPAFDPVFTTGKVAGDQVERNTLLKGIANLVTTRSDVFTVYLRVRAVAQDQASGKWDGTKAETLIDESRYILVVDRSGVDRPGEEPKILMFEKIVE